MKKLKYIIIIFFSILYACERDATVDIPKVDPKIVVQSFFSAQDTAIFMTISKSIPVLGNVNKNSEDIFVENAELTIQNSQKTVKVPFDKKFKIYYLSQDKFNIEDGQTYRLNVSVAGLKSVEATTTTAKNTNKTLKITSVDVVEGIYGKDLRVKFEFRSDKGLNYYRVLPYIKIKNQTGQINSFLKAMDLYHGSKSIKAESEKRHSFIAIRNMPDIINTKTDSIKIIVYLLTTDKNYYNYQKTIENYSYMDPFSEPTHIKSNIVNGLGIFSSFNKYKKEKVYKYTN